jgi:hypothetical protein
MIASFTSYDLASKYYLRVECVKKGILLIVWILLFITTYHAVDEFSINLRLICSNYFKLSYADVPNVPKGLEILKKIDCLISY